MNSAKKNDIKDKAIVLFVHGKGGSADEAEGYRKYFEGMEIYGFDYAASNPWEAKDEFAKKVSELREDYERIILVAASIGAYFSLSAGIDKYIEKAYFISPVVNLERLIMDMISWAGTTEEELKEKRIIPVDFGEDLSWDYLTYVRDNPIEWNTPTEILYGSRDNLQSIDTMREFAEKAIANITVMEGSEHWFHTDEQIRFLDEWMKKVTE